MSSNIISIIFWALTLILLGSFIFWLTLKVKRQIFLKTLVLRVLQIRLYKNSLDVEQNIETQKNIWKNEINNFSQLISIISGLKTTFSVEASVQYIGEDINFYVSVPEASISFVTRQIHGLWPDAQINLVDDYNVFNSQGQTLAAFLKLKENAILPLRTFEEIGADTFSPILSNFSKISSVGEGVAIQLLVKQAPSGFKKTLTNAIRQLKKGVPLLEILNKNIVSEITDILKSKSNNSAIKSEEKKIIVVNEDAVKAMERKMSKPLFLVNLRLIASAPSLFRAEEIINSVAGSYNQFIAPERNEIKIVQPKNPSNLIFKFIFREFENSQSMILGAEELVSLFHFPTSQSEVPKVTWAKSRETAPPLNSSKIGNLIGKSVFRGEERDIYIADEDRRRHLYLIGQTGTGKSTLISNLVINDIVVGKGLAVVDAHGDLIDSILNAIPPERAKDVIIFDPSDIARPIGLNMLEYDLSRPEEKTFIVNEMQGIFNRLFPPESMGPMFEQYMRNALLLLMEDMKNEPATLVDVPRVFTDTVMREAKISRCQNSAVKEFWQKEAAAVGGEHSIANMAPYITSKFNNFVANDYIRPIINQSKSAFNFREIMDSGKILLVNLSKGKIGDINAHLLGMIIVGKILMAAFSRTDLAQEQRRDFYLYIDEFQNFTTDSIAVILSEARKYRLNLVIAHQFIAQLTEKIRDAVFGNIGSQIAFRVGPTDAEFLEKQFKPTFSKNDLINIDNFNAVAKLLIDGQTTSAFNFKTLPPARIIGSNVEQLKELSRNKYGQNRV